MTKTQEQIAVFFNVARGYMDEISKGDDKSKIEENKDVFYALRRMMARLQKSQRKYNEKIQDLEEKYAAVDEKELLVTAGYGMDGRTLYRYKRVDKLKLNEEIRKLFETSQVEFDPYYATSVPTILDDDIKEAFQGFILKPDEATE